MFGNKLSRGILPNIKTPRLKENDSGVVQNQPDSFLNDSMAATIQNMHSVQENVWSADNAGYSIVNTGKTPYESGASIDGMVWYPDTSGNDHLYFAANSKLKECNVVSGAATDIDPTAGYTLGAQVEFATYLTGGTAYLYSCDGNIPTPRKWDGTVASNAGGWPLSDGINSFSRPTIAGTYQGRLATANFSGFAAHIAFSNYQAPDTCTIPAINGTDGYIAQVGNEAGQQIRGFRSVPVPRTNTEVAIIAKDRAIYAITGNSAIQTDATPFSIIKINDEYGAFNNRSMIRYGNDVYAFSEKGVISYTSASQSGDIQPIGINSDLVLDTLASLNLNSKSKCWAIHLADRREMWFAMPTGSSTQVDTILVYRYATPGDPYSKPKWSIRTSAGVFKPSYGVRMNRDFYTGFYNGTIGKMFNGAQYDTTGIPWKYSYGRLSYGNEKQFKQIPDADAHFKVRSNQTVLMESQWYGGNNNDYFSQSVPISTTVSGATWGNFNWGGANWGLQEERIIQFKAPGNGKFNKITLSGTTNTTGPIFLGLTPVVRYGNLARSWN